jgi:hypothetical protein
VLESVDGTYTAMKTPHEHGEATHGYVDLLFEEVPRLSFLTLKMRDHEGSEQVLFEDVPYAEVWRVGNDHDDPLVDPFTLEVVE